MLLSEFEKGYIVGIIDGEGHISVSRHSLSSSKKDVNYRPRIDITNTDIRLPEFLEKKLSGVRTDRCNPSKPNHKPRYITRLLGQDAILSFFDEISPELFILKQRQALLLRKYCLERKKHSRYDGTEEQYYQEFLKLNKRGV